MRVPPMAPNQEHESGLLLSPPFPRRVPAVPHPPLPLRHADVAPSGSATRTSVWSMVAWSKDGAMGTAIWWAPLPATFVGRAYATRSVCHSTYARSETRMHGEDVRHRERNTRQGRGEGEGGRWGRCQCGPPPPQTWKSIFQPPNIGNRGAISRSTPREV